MASDFKDVSEIFQRVRKKSMWNMIVIVSSWNALRKVGPTDRLNCCRPVSCFVSCFISRDVDMGQDQTKGDYFSV